MDNPGPVMDLPALFDRKGAWVGYDSDLLASLPPDRVETYQALEAVAASLAEMEVTIKSLQADIATHNDAAVEWENTLRANQRTFLDEWQESKRTRAHERNI
jgi:hypothetical protein